MSSPRPTACIVGAGAAGLTLAHVLAQHGHRVTLLEGGSTRAAASLDDSYRVQLVGTPHRGAHEGRFRAWGGSTTRWGGQLWPWERYEFEPRPYLGIDGWPISYDDVERYYDRAFSLLGLRLGTLTLDAAVRRGVLPPGLDPSEFAIKYSTWLPWRLRNFGRSFGRALRRHPLVSVNMETTAVELVPDASGTRITGVRARDASGRETVHRADVVVVAGGAIESTRLLLASFGVSPTSGIGRWLGRGFMDHLSVRVAPFHPNDPQKFARMFSPLFVRDVQYTPRMLLRREVLERERLLAAYGHWDVALPPTSGLLVVREKLRALQAGRGMGLSGAELRRLATGARDVLALARGLVVDRRRYFPRDGAIHLRVDVEQFPDRESRIMLAEGHDAHGLPRVALDWRVSPLERRTVHRAAQLLGDELERRGIGRLEDAPDPFADATGWGELRGDSFHMMGGTRMAKMSADGVVDTNSRVFGIENLYVAGSSVFPTGGMANPTLTLLALTLRLGDHLTRTR